MNKKVDAGNIGLLRYLCVAVENERLSKKLLNGEDAQRELLAKIK